MSIPTKSEGNAQEHCKTSDSAMHDAAFLPGGSLRMQDDTLMTDYDPTIVSERPYQTTYSTYTPQNPRSQIHQSDEMLRKSTHNRKPLHYTEWQPLADGAGPTPFFTDILRAIFTHLDTEQTGMLSPEQYSSFLDSQRYGHDQNFWRRGLKPFNNYPEEYSADATLRAHYDAYFIAYVVRPRRSPPLPIPSTSPRRTLLSLSAAYIDAEDIATAARTQALQPVIDPEGLMPMLILQGFVNLTFVETLREPEVGWQRLSCAIRDFSASTDTGFEVGRGWGPLRRDCLPARAPELLMQTIGRIEEVGRANERKAVEAEKLKIEAACKRDGRTYYHRY